MIRPSQYSKEIWRDGKFVVYSTGSMLNLYYDWKHLADCFAKNIEDTRHKTCPRWIDAIRKKDVKKVKKARKIIHDLEVDCREIEMIWDDVKKDEDVVKIYAYNGQPRVMGLINNENSRPNL